MRRAAVLLLLLALAGCGGSDDAAQAPPQSSVTEASVTELDNVLALRSDFEAASGKTRLLVLLSPT